MGNEVNALANYMDCVRNKKFSKIAFTLTDFMISRIGVIWIIILQGYVQLLVPYMFTSGNLTENITYLWVLINHLSILFVPNFNILYFLLITNVSYSLFLSLKRRLSAVFIFLLGSLLTL